MTSINIIGTSPSLQTHSIIVIITIIITVVIIVIVVLLLFAAPGEHCAVHIDNALFLDILLAIIFFPLAYIQL